MTMVVKDLLHLLVSAVLLHMNFHYEQSQLQCISSSTAVELNWMVQVEEKEAVAVLEIGPIQLVPTHCLPQPVNI